MIYATHLSKKSRFEGFIYTSFITEYLVKDTTHVKYQNDMYEHIRQMKLGGYIARMAAMPDKIYLWCGNVKERNHLEDQDICLQGGA